MKKRKSALRSALSTLGLMVSLTVIGFAGYYIFTAFSSQTNKTTEADYIVSSDVDYKVYLKDNSYIPVPYLGMDQTYITKLVNDVKSDLSFNYKNKDVAPVSYTYKVTGSLSSTYRDDANNGKEAVVWTEEEVLKKGSGTSIAGSIGINEKVTTDIALLDTRVKAFQEEMNIPVISVYKVELNVDLLFDINGEKLTKTHTAVLNIPISPTVFNVDKAVENNVSGAISQEITADEINRVYLIIAVSLVALSLAAIISILKYGYAEEKSSYERELEEIFKLYGERIVAVENVVRTAETEFIDLIGFEEMVELVNELNLPILCWTKEGHKITWFCAIKGNIIYRYTIEG